MHRPYISGTNTTTSKMGLGQGQPPSTSTCDTQANFGNDIASRHVSSSSGHGKAVADIRSWDGIARVFWGSILYVMSLLVSIALQDTGNIENIMAGSFPQRSLRARRCLNPNFNGTSLVCIPIPSPMSLSY